MLASVLFVLTGSTGRNFHDFLTLGKKDLHIAFKLFAGLPHGCSCGSWFTWHLLTIRFSQTYSIKNALIFIYTYV